MTTATRPSAAVSPRAADDRLMSSEKVAELLDVSVNALKILRHKGTGPTFVPLGRAIRYWRNDVLAWIEAQSNP